MDSLFFLLGGLKMTEKKMSLIDRCKQMDIVDFARNNGLAVVNKGRDYRLEDHDSFVFDRKNSDFIGTVKGLVEILLN